MNNELITGVDPEALLNKKYSFNETVWKLQRGILPASFYKYNEVGIYCVRFFKNGKWRYVIVGPINR